MGTQAKNKGAAPGAAPSPATQAKKPEEQAKPATTPPAGKKQFESLDEALVYIKKVEKDNSDLSGSVNEAKLAIEELKKLLKAAKEKSAEGSKFPTIVIDGVTYQVNHGAHGIGDAAALAKNEQACLKILAKKGQQALTKI